MYAPEPYMAYPQAYPEMQMQQEVVDRGIVGERVIAEWYYQPAQITFILLDIVIHLYEFIKSSDISSGLNIKYTY